MDESENSFSPAKRFRIGLHVLVSSMALLSIVVMANYLASRHYSRWDITREGRHHLTPLTSKILKSITNEIHVVVFFDRDKPVFQSIQNLLKEYRYQYPKMIVEAVDYYRDAGGAQRIRTQYQLNSEKDQDLVIFSSGSSVKKIYQRELADYDYSGILEGKTNVARPQNFKGEQAFTSAVVSVTDTRQSLALFLQGHGERDPSSEDEMGYSRFAELLQEKNIRVGTFQFGGTNSLPLDALLIIAGPRVALMPAEVEQIDEFLGKGGRLMALMDFQSVGKRTGLERLFSKWGLEVGDDRVRDPNYHLRQDDLFIVNFSGHPAVRSLVKASLYMILPRSVRKISGGMPSTDGLKVEEIAFTSESGEVAVAGRPGEPVSAPRRAGTTPVVMAVERGGVTGVKADRGSTRIVVAGDSVFLGNQTIEQLANREFANDAANWLLDRALLVGEIGPKALKEYRLTLTAAQLNTLRWTMMAGMPGVVVLMGLMVWVRRNA